MAFRIASWVGLIFYFFLHCSSGQKAPSDQAVTSEVAQEPEKIQRICVTGDGVRMRSGPSLNSRVLGNYYWLDTFEQWEVVGEPVPVGDFNKPWYLVKGVHHGAASSPFQGYMYGQFLGDCDAAFEEVGQRLSNTSIPWQDRIMNLDFSAGYMDESYRNHRFREGRQFRSWKATDSAYLTTNGTDVLSIRKQGNLLITDWNLREVHAFGNQRGQIARSYSIRCEYNGFDLKRDESIYFVTLNQVGNNKHCQAEANVTFRRAPTYEAYPDG